MNAPLSYWLFRIGSTLRWYVRAQTRYDVHSPHLVSFIREVYRDDRYYHAFGKIRDIRKYWKGQRQSVKLRAQGAKSKTTNRSERSAASLVATNAISDRSGRFLFRLSLWVRARRILEFGTNAGISTLYLAEADPRAEVHTVEGNPEVATLAQTTFKLAGLQPRADCALFSDWLHDNPPTAEKPYDLVFIDGDHRRQATLDYVRQLLNARTPASVFVVADIHWSEGMERAWEELKTWPEVTASVDTYHFGLLFFEPGLNGPHVTLLPTRYKPWRLGFFS
ncbi:O-methyltransferase [Neolewinella antarctica]|uniref:O-methyltransferase YrrM n=1 Tax=Neolewinella antarctica TaxID=442734 RepID=A0ABX0X8D6_9BACT|nr:class I SAM-dependent methyltransferase [Neolewinella antarctica]NJC25234.1 putative O-methyltransferase YrrM [Neolewinella antarctica]